MGVDFEGGPGTYIQSPAGTSFSVLYGRVANYVLGPLDPDFLVIAKEGINSGVKRLNTRNWYWTAIKQDVTFTATQQEYSIGTTFKEMRAIELLNASVQVAGSLDYVDPKTFDGRYGYRVSQGTSPSVLTIFNQFDNGLLTLDASPSAGFAALYPTLRLRYYRRTQYLSNDADLFAGPSEVEEFLVWHGRAVAAAHYAPEKVPYAERKASDWWRDILRSNTVYGTAAWRASW